MQIPASASTPNLTRPPVPGVVSYSSPQSLIGKRDLFLRTRPQASFYGSPTPEPHFIPTIYSQSDAGSMHNHPGLPPSSRENSPDFDNLPLSTRRQVLRQSSLDQLGAAQQQQQPYLNLGNTASTPDFDSHQPVYRRASGTHIRTEAARQAQLATFRTSVQAGVQRRGGLSPFAAAGWDRNAEQRRNFLLGQREAEAQRREMERAERARNEAEFEERMRSGELLGAHRDAMRRLQGGVRDAPR